MNALARVTIYEPTTIELEAARRRERFRASIAARAAALHPAPAAVAPVAPLSMADALAPQRFPPLYPPPHIPDTFYDSAAWANDEPQPPHVTIRAIQRAVSDHFEMSVTEMLANRRNAPVVRIRQMAIYLCKELTGKSLPDIGRRFGGKDHTTILHAIRRVTALALADSNTAQDICIIKRKLGWRP